MGNHRMKIMLAVIQSILWLIIGAAIGMVVASDMDGIAKALIISVISLITIVLIIVLAFFVSKEFASGPKNMSQTMSQKAIPVYQNAQISGGKKGEMKYQAASEQNAQAQIIRNVGPQREMKQLKGSQHIRKVVLINEEGQELREWSVAGKSGFVIGKSVDKNTVDIDLSDSAFASMISKQHAVLNYTGDKWCVDDIDSKNGTRVKKRNQNAIQDLKLSGALEVEPGDIIYIANTMLQLR